MDSSQIIARIGKKCNFKQGRENDGSRYLELGIMTIRISNHKTHLWTWEYNYGKRMPQSMISIVFEDEPSNSQPILKHPVNKPFTVMEYTYQSSQLTLVDVNKIIYEINSYKRNYTCPLGIAKPVNVQSQNPKIDIEVGVWDANASKIRYNNNLLGVVCKDIPSAKKTIIGYCNSHPVEDNTEIPVYCVVYNCPDTPREILTKYAQCSKAIAEKYRMTNIEPLYESKTNKKKIRLNEVQLRNMIAESVKKVLSELYG